MYPHLPLAFDILYLLLSLEDLCCILEEEVEIFVGLFATCKAPLHSWSSWCVWDAGKETINYVKSETEVGREQEGRENHGGNVEVTFERWDRKS